MNPEWDDNGVPLCDETCPQHDGKRCRLTGCRPCRICEPAVIEMSEELKRLKSNTGDAK